MNNVIKQKISYIKPQMTVLEFKQEATLLTDSCTFDCNTCNDDDIDAVLKDKKKLCTSKFEDCRIRATVKLTAR